MLRNVTNGHRYIGSAVNLRKRRNGHLRHLRNGRHHNAHLQAAWNLYGADAFEFMSVAYVDTHNLLLFEQLCLDGLKPEYNTSMVAGSPMAGRKHSDDARKKMSDSGRGRPSHLRGITLSDEHKAKLSASKRGQKRTSEFSKHMSEMRRGKPQKPHTEAHKEKVRQKLMGNTNSTGKNIGQVRTPEQRDRIRQAVTEWWAERKASNG